MPVTITINGLPSECPHCGHVAAEWLLTVYAAQLIVACPECFTKMAPVFASRA